MIMHRPTSGPVPVSKLRPVAPLDRGFNAAVHHIAGRLLPRGFKVVYGIDPSLKVINKHMAREGRMIVNGDHSDRTIFADPETNHAFRAWHDWCHWKLQAEFNLAGENQVAALQCEQVRDVYGLRHYGVRQWMRLILAEVVGQAAYINYHGQFPTDQAGFDLHYIAGGSITRVFH